MQAGIESLRDHGEDISNVASDRASEVRFVFGFWPFDLASGDCCHVDTDLDSSWLPKGSPLERVVADILQPVPGLGGIRGVSSFPSRKVGRATSTNVMSVSPFSSLGARFQVHGRDDFAAFRHGKLLVRPRSDPHGAGFQGEQRLPRRWREDRLRCGW